MQIQQNWAGLIILQELENGNDGVGVGIEPNDPHQKEYVQPWTLPPT
jgi:hypothetical protein